MNYTVAMQVLTGTGCGTILGAAIACLPGMHIYNFIGLLIIAGGAGAAGQTTAFSLPLVAAMITSWAILNSLTSVILAAPDESAMFTILPGQHYLLAGRGREAIMLTVAGGLGGLLVFMIGVVIGAPFLPAMRSVLQPHFHWMLWAIIVFMLMSEWPQSRRIGEYGWRNWAAAWRGCGVGILTFLLAGFLGLILMNRPFTNHMNAFQGLMPAFVGLFGIPPVLMNLLGRVAVPPQTPMPKRLDINLYHLLKGVFSGTLGGGFATFVPAVSGGVGGMLAGHATAQRDGRIFLIAQGASKTVYYIGGLLLFFLPGFRVGHGGGSLLVRVLNPPETGADYLLITAAVLMAGGCACLLAEPCATGLLAIIGKIRQSAIAWGTLAIMSLLVGLLTGAGGLLIMLVAAAIGLLPIAFGSRRMNGLGLVLLPVACSMSGLGPAIVELLGLFR